MSKNIMLEYRILIFDDNERYLNSLREEISAINYRNDAYRVRLFLSRSPQEFRNILQLGEFDVIILDTCTNSSGSNNVCLTDMIRSDLGQNHWGPELYTDAIQKCPEALYIVLSNLETRYTRTEFNNVDAYYFCKKEIKEKQIANKIKNYFDTQRQRLINNIFVVYGHDEVMRKDVERYIKQTGYNSMPLLNSSCGIRTIFDALVSCTPKTDCALILLSPDDIVYNNRGQFHSYRARQNVILELGYFAGALGRENVIVLYKPDVNFEFPSDISGIYYIRYAEDNKWKPEILSALQTIERNLS